MSFDPNINTKASGFCVSGFSDSDSTHPDRHFPGSSCKYVSANFYGKSHGILVAGLLSDTAGSSLVLNVVSEEQDHREGTLTFFKLAIY